VQLSRRCAKLAQHPGVRHFRNTGMIWAFDAASDDPAFARKFYQAALARGLLLRPLGNTVYFMPPYLIDEGHMDFLVEGTGAILDSLL